MSCTPEFFFSTPEFFSSLSPGFFQVYVINLKKIQVTNWKKNQVYWKKISSEGPERFKIDLNFSRSWFSEIKVQNKWLKLMSNWYSVFYYGNWRWPYYDIKHVLLRVFSWTVNNPFHMRLPQQGFMPHNSPQQVTNLKT